MGVAEFGVYGMCQRLSRTLMRGLGRASGSGRCGLGVNHRFFGRIDDNRTPIFDIYEGP